MACSLACAPNCTTWAESIRTVEVPRGDPGPEFPVYQETVLAEPLIRLVADPNGDPLTRSGGWAAVTVPLKPSAANAAAFELVIDNAAALSVRSVITPPLTVDGFELPVIWSIFDSRAWTLSVTLSWLPVAPDATKLIVVPFTVMVLPGAKLADSELVPATPDSAVVPLTGAAGKVWLLTTLPLAVPSVLKKLSPASTAEAATSLVLASVPIAVFSAALRFAVVAAGVAPIAKLPVGVGTALEAVNWKDSVVPSGRLKAKLILSPELG